MKYSIENRCGTIQNVGIEYMYGTYLWSAFLGPKGTVFLPFIRHQNAHVCRNTTGTGKRVRKAVKRIDVGGKLLTNHLKEIISYRYVH
jgi:hypothetical protein